MNNRKRSKSAQSARFIEAAKTSGADQKDFERVFRKVVKPKPKRRSIRK